MSSVDNRIVAMKFDNAQFERGVNTTLGSLDRLKNSLNFTGAAKGLDDIQASANSTNFGPLEGGITGISKSFMAMSTVAIAALTKITHKAMEVGTQLVKSLTIDPVLEGFREYELKMGSIQTIMAGSGEPLEVVNQKLQELNAYSDKTIYSFKDMTDNIGKFTNAGLGLDVSVAAIQGVANVAALSGANAGEASRAMYNFAQALSSGSVKLMDWKSIELANMATAEFKTELLESAVAAGTLTKDADGLYKTLKGTPVTATKGFNESLTEQWLTTEALVETLGRYSDETTDIGARATAAAQDVKTFSQMMDTLKESVASGWSETSELIFGNFDEAKALWTELNNTIGGILDRQADARNELLGEWNKLGGRDVVLDGLRNAFTALGEVLKPIKEAFREIFPAKTGQDLYNLSVKFKEFTEKLKVSETTAQNLKSTFKGVFAIFSIASQVIKGVIGVFGKLIGAVTGSSGGFLAITGKIGEFVSSIDKALREGKGLTKFFETLGNILAVPIQIFGAIGTLIADLFGGFDLGKANEVTDTFGRFEQRLSPLGRLVQRVSDIFKNLTTSLGNLGEKLQPVMEWLINGLKNFGSAIAESFSNGTFSTVLDTVNTGLFGALVLMFKKFFSGGIFGEGGIFGSAGGGMFENISASFEAITGSLQAMQQNIKADTLMKIAIALSVLTLSIIGLSMIDSAALTKSMTAITAAFAQLLGAMAILTKIGGVFGSVKIPIIAAGMILLSTAVLVLSAAVKNLADLDWDELGRGLVGVAGTMLILVAASKPLSANASGMIRAGAGMLVLSVAIRVMANALEAFGTLDWGVMGKGLLAMASALTVVTVAMRLMPKNMLFTATSILILSGALNAIASAMTKIGGLSLAEIGKGLVGIAGSLVIIAGAMRLMPKNMLFISTSLILVGVALQGVAKALTTMGGMTWEEIAKGLVTLAGAMLILALGLTAMSGSLAGSAALAVAAGALSLLVPVIMALGSMNIAEIVTGLGALAGVFVVLGLAGLVLTPLVPTLLGLGGALALVGAGLALAGAGTLAFTAALAILVGMSSATAVVIAGILQSIADSIPGLMVGFANGLIAFAAAITKGAPTFLKAFVSLLLTFLKAVNIALPQIAKTTGDIISKILDVLTEAIPKMARAGMKILLGILDGIGDNIYRIVTAATRVITEFLRGIGDNQPKIVKEGAKTIIKFVNGLSDAIDDHAAEMGRAGGRLATSIIKGMAKGLFGGVGEIVNAAKNVAKDALNAAKNALGIKSPSRAFMEIGRYADEGFAKGLLTYSRTIDASAEEVGNSTLETMRTTMAKVASIANEEIDVNPVIAPVLDLDKFRKEAGYIQKVMDTESMTAGVSYGRAASISQDYEVNRQTAATAIAEKEAATIKFEQNNYSPKALSHVEIYRNTRNQLALAKEALNAS